MRIYVSHARHGDFATQLYEPLRKHVELAAHELILPHEDPSAHIDSLVVIPTCDLVFAEVSHPSTGQGIELGWAAAKAVPVITVAHADAQVSASVTAVSRHITRYRSSEDLPPLILAAIAQRTKPYRRGVSALIVNAANELLLIQKHGYAKNQWNVPGGGREEGETLEENLARELREELGMELDAFEQIGTSAHRIEYDYPPDVAARVNGGLYRGQSYDQVILRFVGDPAALQFSALEFTAHRWAPLDSLQQYLTFPHQYDDHQRALDEFRTALLLPR